MTKPEYRDGDYYCCHCRFYAALISGTAGPVPSLD